MRLIELSAYNWQRWSERAGFGLLPSEAILVADDSGPCCCLTLKRVGAFLFAELGISNACPDVPLAIKVALKALRGLAMTSGATPVVITPPKFQAQLEEAGMQSAPYALMSFKKEQPRQPGVQSQTTGAVDVTAPNTTSEPPSSESLPTQTDDPDMDGLDAIVKSRVKADRALTSLRPDRRRSSASPERSEPPAAPSEKPKRAPKSPPAK